MCGHCLSCCCNLHDGHDKDGPKYSNSVKTRETEGDINEKKPDFIQITTLQISLVHLKVAVTLN